MILRWQARLDARWADRVVPWAAAGVLFVLFGGLALARARSIQGGEDLATWVQGAWLMRHSESPELSLTGNNLLAGQLPLGFYPIAVATRVLPAIPTLLLVQSAALALGVVPLWRIARRICDLRVGAAAALTVAYAASPAVNNLNLADFDMAAVALPALLAAAYLGLTARWRAFAVVATVAVLCRADLGLAVAGLGVLLAATGHRRQGLRAAALALGWTLIAALLVQPAFGDSGLIAPGAFASYGDSFLGVAGGMISHPYRVVGDLLAVENLDLAIQLLAPLLFLPVLAPRYLAPAIPLEALYLVADVPPGGTGGAEYTVAITAFLFVAAAFALSRLGRRSVERIVVDRRILVALVLASVVFFSRDADNSPYRRPWRWGRQDIEDAARLEVVDLVGDDDAVRASPSMLPLLAERRILYEFRPSSSPPARLAARNVDTVVVDARSHAEWDEDDQAVFATALAALGFRLDYEAEGVSLWHRVGQPVGGS